MTAPLVTIGIPTLERIGFLIEAVEAALAQTWTDIEVVVGDDGRDVRIQEWCTTRAAVDSRLRYHRNPKRLGLGGNWTEIARRAAGEFIVLPGDDDRLLPDFVSRLRAAAADDTAVVFSNHYVIDDSGGRIEGEADRLEREYARAGLESGQVDNAAACAWQLAISPTAALIRRVHVLRLGFASDLNSPDVEFFIRLAREGARFDFVAERLAEFRLHSRGSATAAGLRHDELVARLLRLPAGAGAEPFKRGLLQKLMINAVSRSLQQGNWDRAREFLRSPYYPETTRATARFVQRACATLPRSLGVPVYRTIASVKRAALP